MKSAYLTLIALVLIGCEEPKYCLMESQYRSNSTIPDSNKAKYAEFIQKTVSAASLHMTTSDYEDVDETIKEATETAERLYAINSSAMVLCECGTTYQLVAKSPEQILIEDSLIREFNRKRAR